MYDIYFANTSIIPDGSDEKMYLGSLDLYEHKAIEKKFNSCENIEMSYFDDAYIELKDVLKILETFQSSGIFAETDFFEKAYKKMHPILITALEKKHGIFAYCDQ